MNNTQYENLIALINTYLLLAKSDDEFTRALATRELRKLRNDLIALIKRAA